MKFDSLDAYLLEGKGSKANIIAQLLANRSELPSAQPFYRALERVGARAADEALIALRLVLAGKLPSDLAVAELREIVAAARDGDPEAPARYERALS